MVSGQEKAADLADRFRQEQGYIDHYVTFLHYRTAVTFPEISRLLKALKNHHLLPTTEAPEVAYINDRLPAPGDIEAMYLWVQNALPNLDKAIARHKRKLDQLRQQFEYQLAD